MRYPCFLTLFFSVLIYFSINCSLVAQAQSPQHYPEPNFTPTVPEAASLGRYGNHDIMSATGRMSYSVPIYNIQVNGNSWPVSLDYSFGGLILEGKPSLSGLGWHLSAYSSITKEVRGLPDGHPYGYYGEQNIKQEIDAALADYDDNHIFDQIHFVDFKKFRDGVWDSEVDKYTINLRDTPFSFKLRKVGANVEAYFLSKHDYKVDITMDTQEHFEVASFVVTDGSGIKYHFDADDREYVYTDPDAQYTEDKTTSWLLSSIDYGIGNDNRIIFEYDEVQYFSWDFWANGISLHADIDDGPYQNKEVIQYYAGYSDGMLSKEMRRQVLSSITFPSGQIQLTDSKIGNTSLFNTLTLRNSNNSIIDHYDFTYEGNRDNLTRINRNNEFYYGFDYNLLTHVPPFFESSTNLPRAQDHWRFNNGQLGNTSAISLADPDYIANKTPNFIQTRAGALSQINYQTGGYTKVVYEQNQVKKPFTGAIEGGTPPPLNEEISIELHPNMLDQPWERDVEVVVEHTFDTPTFATISHEVNGRVVDNYFALSILKIDGEACELPTECYDVNNLPANLHYDQMANFMRNNMTAGTGSAPCIFYPYPILCPKLLVSYGPDTQLENNININKDSGGYVYISPGTYQFKITTKYNGNVLFNAGDIFGKIRVRYHNSTTNGETPEYINKEVGGIRVAQLVDYNEYGDKTNVKDYNYNDEEGFSTARLNQIPLFSNSFLRSWRDSNHDPYAWENLMEIHELNGFTALSASDGIPVYYRQISVTNPIKKSEDEGGGIVVTLPGGEVVDPITLSRTGIFTQEFSLPMEDNGYSYPKIPRQVDESKVKTISSVSRKQLNLMGDTEVLSASTSEYGTVRFTWEQGTQNDTNPDHPRSFKIYNKQLLEINYDQYCYCLENPNVNNPYEFDEDQALKRLHDIVIYKEVNARKRLNSVTTTTNGIMRTTTHSYDANQHLQSTVTNNSRNDQLTVEYDYPSELTQETQYQNMLNKNQVNAPVAQRSYKNGQLLSQQKTNFTSVQNIYMPQQILAAKGDDNLEEQIKYQYDSDGRIKEYRTKNGTSPPTAFIWGYDETLPVVKIENATYDEAFDLLNVTYQQLQNMDSSSLRTQLDRIRQGLPNAQVTTYTHKPLVGVTSITDPRGNTTYYEYDIKNRLKIVKDKDNNILSKKEYNYRPQN